MNIVILNGRLGKDPEEFSAGVRFSVATTEHFNGEEKTQWHNVTAFGKTGEFVQKYFSRGKAINIQGRIEYFKKDEDSPAYTNIIAERVMFPMGDGKKGEGGGEDSKASAPPKPKKTPKFDDDDDIPF
jgi:single-stranded DNA-binding protein|nr:MAG TPA: Single strand binding protein [Caudoviricetes sp.]